MTEVEWVQSMKVLQVQPGDVIVIKVQIPMTVERNNRIENYLRQYFPNNRCIILESGSDIGVIRSTSRPYPME